VTKLFEVRAGRPKDRWRIVSDVIGVAFGEQRERLGVTVSNALCRHDVIYQIDAGLKAEGPLLFRDHPILRRPT